MLVRRRAGGSGAGGEQSSPASASLTTHTRFESPSVLPLRHMTISDSPYQHTLRGECAFSGRGLHSGEEVQVRLVPAAANTGLVFCRTDLADKPEIPAHIEYAKEADLQTVLVSNGVEIKTPEHLLSACWGMGIDNLKIEISAPEPPVRDGSARDFVADIERVGLARQTTPRQMIRIREETRMHADKRGASESEQSTLMFSPPTAPALQLQVSIDFLEELIGFQRFEFLLTPERYKQEVSEARTFITDTILQGLRQSNLGKGGSLDNTVVVKPDGKSLRNAGALRWADEFVRHKALDLIGDLSLLGARISGRVSAHRPSHATNSQAMRTLLNRTELWEYFTPEVTATAAADATSQPAIAL